MPKDNCSKHPTSILGESDMKVVAGLISDLNYESLSILIKELSKKIRADGNNDFKNGKVQLGNQLKNASRMMKLAQHHLDNAWQISKPFMEQNNN